MTEAQRLVLTRLKAIGGAGWLGDGVDRASSKFQGFAMYCGGLKRFWGEEAYKKWQADRKKFGITDKGVWCSSVTRRNLLNAGLITHVIDIPGAWMLTDRAKELLEN